MNVAEIPTPKSSCASEEWAWFFLRRLSHLAEIHAALMATSRLGASDPVVKLVSKALFSTYLDCLDHGLGREARALLPRPRHSQERQHV